MRYLIRPIMLLPLALLISLIIIQRASTLEAHAILVKASPAPSVAISTRPPKVTLWFSEPLNPSLSSIQVLNANKQRVDSGHRRVGEDDAKRMEVDLTPLPEGVYTVLWTTNSLVDGHTIKGSYLFAVATTNIPAGFTTEGGTADTTSTLKLPGISWSSSQVVDTTTRWLVLVAALLYVGGWLFLWAVPGFIPRAHRDIWSGEILQPAMRRWQMMERVLLVVLFIATLANLLAVAASASQSWRTTFTTSFFPSFLTSSRFGVVSLSKLLLAWLLMFLPPVRRLWLLWQEERRVQKVQPANPGRHPSNNGWALWSWNAFVILLGSAFLALVALSGHAAAISFPLYSSLLLDWLHLMAAAAWLGGIAFLALIVIPAQRTQAPLSWKSFSQLLAAFSPIALTSVAVLVFTGVFSAETRLASPSELVSTSWGRFLLVKLVLVALVLAVSYIHVFILRPRVLQHASNEGSASGRWLSRLISYEPFLGLGVLALTVLLAAYPFPGAAGRVQNAPQAPSPQTAPVAFSPRFSLAQRAENLFVELRVATGEIGRNDFDVRIRDAMDGRPVEGPVLVRLRTRFLDQDAGSQYVVTQAQTAASFRAAADFTLEGRWQVEVIVRRPDKPDVSALFEFPVPVKDASSLLAQVEQRMNRLKTLREELTGIIGKEKLTIVTEYESPNKVHQRVQNGTELYIIGGARYFKQPGEDWQVRPPVPGLIPFTWPSFNFQSLVQSVTLGESKDASGVVTLAAAFDEQAELYYIFWLGKSDLLVHRWEHLAPGHFLTIKYSDYDSPSISIQTPTTGQGR